MDKGTFFCYLDGQRFATKLQLLNHLGCEHVKDQEKLAKWGINWMAVCKQAEFLNGQLTITLDRKKDKMRMVQKEIRGQALQILKQRERD